MKTYEFAIQLQDKFSPILNRMSSNYQSKTNLWERLANQTQNRFLGMGRAVDSFRTKLNTINRPVRIKVDSSELDQANRKANGLSALLSGGGKVGRFALGAVGGAFLGGAGALALASRGLGAAQQTQAARFQFGEQMGGMTARLLERGVRMYAPERRDDMMNAGRHLYEAGIPGGNMLGTLKLLNNISTYTGIANTELAKMVGTVRSTGKAGGELDRLRDSGLNLTPYLAQAMKVPEKQIRALQEKGLIGSGAFEKALTMLAGNGGKLGNVYERYKATTVEGKEKYLRGRVNERMEAMGEKLLPYKMKVLDFLIEVVDKIGPAEKALSGLGRSAIGALRPLWDWFGRVGERFGLFTDKATPAEKIVAALAAAFNKLTGFVDTVGKGIDFLVNNPIGKLIVGMTAIYKLMGLVGGVGVTAPFGGVAAGFVAIAGALWIAYENSEKFRNSILDGIEGWKVFFNGLPTAWRLFSPQTMPQFFALSESMDQLADRNAANRIALENHRRFGQNVPKNLPNKSSLFNGWLAKKQAEEREKEFQGLFGGGGGKGSIAASAGLSSTVGSSKSQSITITMQSLINHSEINVMSAEEGIDDLERKMMDALSRVLMSAGAAAGR